MHKIILLLVIFPCLALAGGYKKPQTSQDQKQNQSSYNKNYNNNRAYGGEGGDAR